MGWKNIIANPKFAAERPEDKQRIAENYFQRCIAANPEFQAEAPDAQERIHGNFMKTIPPLKRSGIGGLARSAVRGPLSGVGGVFGTMAAAEQAPQLISEYLDRKTHPQPVGVQANLSRALGPSEEKQVEPPSTLSLPNAPQPANPYQRRQGEGQNEYVARAMQHAAGSPAIRSSENLPPLSIQGLLSGAAIPTLIETVPEVLGSMGTSLALSGGSAPAAGLMMGMMDAGSQYLDRKDQYEQRGLSKDEARMKASQETLAYLPVSILLEKVGMEALLRPLKTATKSRLLWLAKRFASGAATEVPQEVLQGNAQDLINYSISGDDVDFQEMLDHAIANAVLAGVTGGLMKTTTGLLAPPPPVTPEQMGAATAPLTAGPETGKTGIKSQSKPVIPGEAPDADITIAGRHKVNSVQRKRLEGKVRLLQESLVSQALRDGREIGGDIRLDLVGADAQDAEFRFAEAIGETFGIEVIPVAGDGVSFNGATNFKVRRTIFLNTHSSNPAQFLVGHELQHIIENELGRNHVAVDAFRQAVAGAINDPEAYRVWLSESTGEDYSADDSMREHRADFLGQNIAKPEFWQRLSETAPGVFRRTAEMFLSMLRKIKATLIGKNYDAERWMAASGLEGARKTAANLLIEYRRSGGQPPSVAEPVAPKRTAKSYEGKTGSDYVYVHPNDTTEHPIRYRLVEAEGLVQSNDPQTFSVNPDYPQALQPRDYATRPNEKAKVVSGALKLDPRRVISGDLGPENGPPVVTIEGVVLAGNARTMMIKRAAGTDPALYQPYKDYLAQHANEYGLTAAEVQQMRRPVLVRELQGLPQEGLVDFAARANDTGTAAYDLISDSMRVAGRMDSHAVAAISLEGDETIREVLGDPDKAAPFIQSMRASGALTPQNEAVYVDSEGRLTSIGKDLLENALLAKVFEGPSQRQALEYFGFDRGRRQAVMRALPDLVRLKQMIEGGLPQEYNIAEPIYDLARAMQEKKVHSWADLQKEQDFVSPLTEEQLIVGQMLADLMDKPIRFAQKIGKYVDFARAVPKEGEATLMPLTRLDVLRVWADPNFLVDFQKEREDLNDIFASTQETLEKQPPVTSQGDMLGGIGKALTESALTAGTPSINKKLGKSKAAEGMSDLFPETAREPKGKPAKSQKPPDIFEGQFQRERFDPEEFKKMYARAMAEKEGERTIGRPELANPAGTEPSRRLVDTFDQLREDQGIPERQADAQVEEQAMALLETDYAGTRQMLLNRASEKAGLNAIETRAAQEILRRETFEAAKTGNVDALVDMQLLTTAWRETGTEQARGFRQRQDRFKNPADRAAAFVAEALVKPDPATQQRLDKAKTPEEMREILRDFAKQMETLRAKLLGLGVDLDLIETAKNNPKKMAHAIKAISVSRAGFWDVLKEYWICSILSGPKTQGANIVGNVTSIGWDFTAQRLAESLVNVFARDPGSAQFGEFPYIAAGLVPGLVRGTRNALRSIIQERPVFEEELLGKMPFEGSTKHGLRGPAIKGIKGRVIRTPISFLMAMDELDKSWAAQMQVGAVAYRMAHGEEGLRGEPMRARMAELMDDLQSDAWSRAFLHAKYLVFQEELGNLGKWVMKSRKLPTVGHALFFQFPFIKTFLNIFKMGVRKSPVGSVALAKRLAWQGAVKLNWNKGNWEYPKSLFVRDTAEQLLAWGLTYLLVGWLHREDDEPPSITGTKPWGTTSPGERAAAWRIAPPQSIKIGDAYHSYARIEPLATTLALTVDMIEDVRKAKTGQDYLAALGKVVLHITEQTRNKTFMQGMGDLLDALESPRNAGKGVANFASSWMPNIFRQTGRARESYIREGRVWGAAGAEWMQNLMRRTGQKAWPFGENHGMPKVTPWGEDIKSGSMGSPLTTFVYRVLVPSNIVDIGDRDPRAVALDRLLLTWNNEHPKDIWWPGIPAPNYTYPKAMTLKSGKAWITDKEYHDFLKVSGTRILDRLSKMKLNVEHPTIRDIRIIQSTVEAVRKDTRARMFNAAKMKAMKAASP